MRELTKTEISIVSGGEKKPPSEGIKGRTLDAIYNAAYDFAHSVASGIRDRLRSGRTIKDDTNHQGGVHAV